MSQDQYTCSICGGQYEGWGNNAKPVNNGRCCDACNWEHVIPARLEPVIVLMSKRLNMGSPQGKN